MFRNKWWAPLLSLSSEHLALVKREGLLVHLQQRAEIYRNAATRAENERTARELSRRAALLRESYVALDRAASS
jgi:hypothetical protein